MAIVRTGMKFAKIAAGMRWRPVCLHFTLVTLALFAAAGTIRSQTPPKTHIVSVKFDYNFRRFHGCKRKNKAPCVKQFNVYNVTDTGKRFLLFSIPARPGAKDEVKNITGTSKPLVFAPGQHMIAVTASTDLGVESDVYACRTMVNVAP
jgi:hypothetical protein